MATTTASRKDKGRRLQKEVKAIIHKYFPFLGDDDVISKSMGSGGEDIILSKAAREVLPLSIECKATEKFNLREAWEQAEANAKNWNAVVIHRKNRTKPVAVCELEYFIELHSHIHKVATMYIELKHKMDGLEK